eukprot:299964-Alexandrium_andersonii.AAC.1
MATRGARAPHPCAGHRRRSTCREARGVSSAPAYMLPTRLRPRALMRLQCARACSSVYRGQSAHTASLVSY